MATDSDIQARVALLEKEKGDALELIATLRKRIYALEEENDLLALDNERLKGRSKQGVEGRERKSERARQGGERGEKGKERKEK
jgi:regulator of replication initiation timing